jgi:predicted  nucleic acid-binding Zn-ribbon protein
MQPGSHTNSPSELLDARLPHERKESSVHNEAINKASTGMALKSAEKPSFAVQAIREQYAHDATNAEDHARKLTDHIRAIDEELEALSEERARLAEQCLEATKAMTQAIEKCVAIANNDYRG